MFGGKFRQISQQIWAMMCHVRSSQHSSNQSPPAFIYTEHEYGYHRVQGNTCVFTGSGLKGNTLFCIFTDSNSFPHTQKKKATKDSLKSWRD